MKLFDKRAAWYLRLGNAVMMCAAAWALIMQIGYGVKLMSYVPVTATVVDQYSQSTAERNYYFFICEYEYDGYTYSTTQRANYSDKFSVGKEIELKINPKRPAEVRDGSLIGGYCALDLLIAIIWGGIYFRMNKEIKDDEAFHNRSGNYLESEYEINREKQSENYRKPYEDSDFYK